MLFKRKPIVCYVWLRTPINFLLSKFAILSFQRKCLVASIKRSLWGSLRRFSGVFCVLVVGWPVKNIELLPPAKIFHKG